MKFSLSVVIPAYNVEKFIYKAIYSALDQVEVKEVIVVNDGSTDNTLKIVETIAEAHPKIKLYHHNNYANKGRSASRNLGIKKATGKYIAFLDADDFYLPNRFKNDKVIFQEKGEVDGVYNAIGAHFYRNSPVREQNQLDLYTVSQEIDNKVLFETLLSGTEGHFSIDGLTVKRSIFDKVGYFTETLVVMEDTELIWKMAIKCHLKTGIIDKPLAMRGVHEDNVFNREDLYKEYRVKMHESLFFWAGKNRIPLKKMDLLLNSIWVLKFKKEDGLIRNLKYWAYLFFKNPRTLFTLLGIKYFPIIRLRKKLFPFLYR